MEAIAWAMNPAWLFAKSKLISSILLALLALAITVLIVRKSNNDWRVRLMKGIVVAIGTSFLFFFGVFVFNLLLYPVYHEAELKRRPHTFGPNTTFVILDELQRANLKVSEGWNIILTGPPGSDLLQSNLKVIMQRGLVEVHFLDTPGNRVDLNASQFPEPSEERGITLHGNNALADALRVLGSCLLIRITDKTVDHLEQFYDVKNLLWIEIGKGSPWLSDVVCSG
jgi:hypothetical protein